MPKLLLLNFLIIFFLSFSVQAQEPEPKADFHAEDEAELKDLEAKKEAAAKKNLMIQQSLENIKNGGPKNEEMVSLFGTKVPKSLVEMKESPFSFLPREQVHRQLSSNNPPLMEFIFQNIPVSKEIATDFLHDKNALPKFMGFFKKEKELKNYGIITLVIFIIFLWLRRGFIPKDGPFIKKFFISMIFKAISWSMYLGLFHYYFEEEVGPLLVIISKHLF